MIIIVALISRILRTTSWIYHFLAAKSYGNPSTFLVAYRPTWNPDGISLLFLVEPEICNRKVKSPSPDG